MSPNRIDRRRFLSQSAAGLAAAALARSSSANADTVLQPEYRGPNVVILRFGGGVRRLETIDPANTYSPYFLHELCKRGTLFPNMEISQLEGVDTSHGQGTLHILTGQYGAFENVNEKPIGERFESHVPTVFEYLRKSFNVPEHQTLIVNGEDRTDEEFYSFSNHHLFGVDYRSNVLSLYRFKVYLLRRQIERGDLDEKELAAKKKELAKLEGIDPRVGEARAQAPEITAFWDRWRQFYGESGFVNPRGDRLLTELAARAIKELRPKLMIVNYNDPDYVHWGNPSHYTRGISIIDEGMRRLVETVDADEAYRDNTVFAIVPDCGRNSNPFISVPFQHHFNSRSSREIFALFFGPGIARGRVVDAPVEQISVASTIGQAMQMQTAHAQGPVLEDAFA